MLSNRPYLLRAFYEWIVDSGCIPILVLDATNPYCKIPAGFSENGEIVFNISANAVRELKMMNDYVEFKASFSGVINLIAAPMNAILAIYAEENGEGLYFDAEEDDGSSTTIGTQQAAPSLLKSVETAATSEQLNVSESGAKVKPFLKLVE